MSSDDTKRHGKTGRENDPALRSTEETKRSRASRAAVARCRRMKAFELRKTGASYDKIGEQMGISNVHAWRLVQQAFESLDKLAEKEAYKLRAMEIEKLNDEQIVAWGVISKERQIVDNANAIIASTTDGRLIISAQREIQSAEDLILKSIDRLVKIAERRAKLLGIDSPVKIEDVTRGDWRAQYADLMNDPNAVRLMNELAVIAAQKRKPPEFNQQEEEDDGDESCSATEA